MDWICYGEVACSARRKKNLLSLQQINKFTQMLQLKGNAESASSEGIKSSHDNKLSDYHLQQQIM